MRPSGRNGVAQWSFSSLLSVHWAVYVWAPAKSEVMATSAPGTGVGHSTPVTKYTNVNSHLTPQISEMIVNRYRYMIIGEIENIGSEKATERKVCLILHFRSNNYIKNLL